MDVGGIVVVVAYGPTCCDACCTCCVNCFGGDGDGDGWIAADDACDGRGFVVVDEPDNGGVD